MLLFGRYYDAVLSAPLSMAAIRRARQQQQRAAIEGCCAPILRQAAADDDAEPAPEQQYTGNASLLQPFHGRPHKYYHHMMLSCFPHARVGAAQVSRPLDNVGMPCATPLYAAILTDRRAFSAILLIIYFGLITTNERRCRFSS